jgi:uncharacterized membrane protein YhaH (DUF805 family)
MNSKYFWFAILAIILLVLAFIGVIVKNIIAIGVVITIVVIAYTRFVNQYGDKIK